MCTFSFCINPCSLNSSRTTLRHLATVSFRSQLKDNKTKKESPQIFRYDLYSEVLSENKKNWFLHTQESGFLCFWLYLRDVLKLEKLRTHFFKCHWSLAHEISKIFDNIYQICIVCIGVSPPSSKTPPLSSLPSPPLNLQTVQAPPF